MPKSSLNVIAIGTAARVFEPGTRERRRMEGYAKRVGSLHVINLSPPGASVPDVQRSGALTVYAVKGRVKPLLALRAVRVARRLLKEEGKWLVTTQDPFIIGFLGWCATLGTSSRLHVQVHGDVFSPRFSTGMFSTLKRWFARWCLRRAAGVRAVSKRIKRSLTRQGVPAERITVLPIQADIGAFLAVGAQRTYETDGSLRFLYVGRFSAEKDLPLLLRAFARHHERYPRSTLTLLGDGPERAELDTIVNRHGLESVVRFEAWTDDVPAAMARADVLCLSSLHEGWAMVAVEAAAAGLPVIMTDVGCAGEFIKDGRNGRVVPVGDMAAFAAALNDYAAHSAHLSTHGSTAHFDARAWALDAEAYYDAWVESLTSAPPTETVY